MVSEGVVGVQNVGLLPAMKTASQAMGTQWPLSSMTTPQGIRYQKRARVDDSAICYRAARIYNAGSVGRDGDLSAKTGGRRCYVSDVVNRLVG